MVPVDELRPLAFSVAYRMLGSVAEAEDVVQEALLRVHEAEGVERPEAFVTTVTTRLSIDVLRSARARRETYVGEWLPEPLVGDDAPMLVEDEETISMAFLVLLERLTPEERAVVVLREAFDYPFAEIAAMLGKPEANCRQILSRARRRIDDDRPRFDPDPQERAALAERFLAAARDGDVDGLVSLLAPDVALTGDGGGRAQAIARTLVGPRAVSRAIAAFSRRLASWEGISFTPVTVNGQPGFRLDDAEGRVVAVATLEIAGGRVRRVQSVVNPDKLRHLGPTSDLALRPGPASA
ncbi:MAG: RNA polymerase sigma-70 factor [Solirubrobacteraceae bacterium]|nr:RNA polymerase sigma-70 factor [Solirubrobacteraceae bacterium]